MNKQKSRWMDRGVAHGVTLGLLAMAATLSACGGTDDAKPATTNGLGTESPSAAGSQSAASGGAAPASASPSPSASAGTAPAPAPAPATTPAPAPTPSGTASAPSGPVALADCGISGMAQQILDRVNAERAKGASCGTQGIFAPTTPLTWNTKLEQAAIGHNSDMVSKNFFSHTSSNGDTLATRITAAGYTYSTAGENIAAGQTSVAVVMAGWMQSDGHCANVMRPSYKDMAVL
jgi:uncharacterized protein YkwD